MEVPNKLMTLSAEILIMVCEEVQDEESLAALSRTCRLFHAICVPLLYRDLNIQLRRAKDVALLKRLASHSMLTRHTRSLKVERHGRIEDMTLLPYIGGSMRRMPDLKHLTFHDSSRGLDSGFWPMKGEAIEAISSFHGLMSLSIDGMATAISASLPNLSNLRRLSLLGMDHRCRGSNSIGHDFDMIANTLLLSPDLDSLALSVKCPTYFDWVCGVCDRYQAVRSKAETPRLNLKKLHTGCLCAAESRSPAPLQGHQGISALTDLSKLECLRLDNDDCPLPILERRQGADPGVNYQLPPHDFGYLRDATNLRELVVQAFNPEVLEVVQALTELETQGPPELSSLKVTGCFECPELNQSGHHWQRLCLGNEDESPQNFDRRSLRNLLVQYIGDCVRLQELSFPVDADDMRLLHEAVIPRLHHLSAFINTCCSRRCNESRKLEKVAKEIFYTHGKEHQQCCASYP